MAEVSLEQKLKNAAVAFEALMPDVRASMLKKQLRSWSIGELMLEHPEMSREQAEQLVDKCLESQ
jgi:hypothetical protein